MSETSSATRSGPGDPPVRLERDGAIAKVILNRPRQMNAINGEVLDALDAMVAEVRSDDSVRVVVISGEGKAFCAGADLGDVDGLLQDRRAFAAFVERWHRTFDAIEALPKPTIGAAHGLALAGGLELLLVCDVVVAAHDARLGDQHARFGLFPGGGATQRLPRVIAPRHAMWLLLSGEWVDGRRAAEIGLVTEAVEPGRVLDRAMEMASLLASRSPLASAGIKEAVAVGSRMDKVTALAAERRIHLDHMASQDARAGIEAFKNRTEPTFTGR